MDRSSRRNGFVWAWGVAGAFLLFIYLPRSCNSDAFRGLHAGPAAARSGVSRASRAVRPQRSVVPASCSFAPPPVPLIQADSSAARPEVPHEESRPLAEPKRHVPRCLPTPAPGVQQVQTLGNGVRDRGGACSRSAAAGSRSSESDLDPPRFGSFVFEGKAGSRKRPAFRFADPPVRRLPSIDVTVNDAASDAAPTDAVLDMPSADELSRDMQQRKDRTEMGRVRRLPSLDGIDGIPQASPSSSSASPSKPSETSESEVGSEAMPPAAERATGAECSLSDKESSAASRSTGRAECGGHLSDRRILTAPPTNPRLACQAVGEASVESNLQRNKDSGDDREPLQLPASILPSGTVDVPQSISEPGSDRDKSSESWTPVSVPAAGLGAAGSAAARDTTFAVIARRVMVLSREAEDLASRGAYYAARAKMIKSLRIITQTLDSQKTGKHHSEALGRAKQAFREVGDFAPRGSLLEAELDVARIISAHRTKIFQDVNVEHLTPLAVRQKYLEYAQRQFAEACDGLPIGSYALYGVGRVYAVMARSDIDKQMLCLPKALTLHQAALLVDSNNVQAANELGVLLAEFGQLKDARRALRHALSIESRPEIWMNLAVVHQRLGESELALEARENGTLMASRQADQEPRNDNAGIKWVDPKTFSETRFWHLR